MNCPSLLWHTPASADRKSTQLAAIESLQIKCNYDGEFGMSHLLKPVIPEKDKQLSERKANKIKGSLQKQQLVKHINMPSLFGVKQLYIVSGSLQMISLRRQRLFT